MALLSQVLRAKGQRDQLMQPRGFNRQRLRLIVDHSSRSAALPNRLELMLSCALAAVVVVVAWRWWL
jgi:hypothetical protein